ncbi:hypothetical protein [Streptomyces sp. CO7]
MTGPDGTPAEIGGLDEMITDVKRSSGQAAPETTAPEQGLRPGGQSK